MVLPQEVIRKKRDGGSLSRSELAEFFGGYLKSDIADYQMGAMLMAITLNGMDPEETAALTEIMRDSGSVFDWGGDRAHTVDKHSTGGIGDKTSMILLPLAALEGVRVPMMAGRGLGHTGGTLDKLQSLGIDVSLSPDQVRHQIAELGGVFMGQTEHTAPLDRKLYALRDVTATVEAPPLIVASILSKKLAEGLGGLVMDVKFGSGAFMTQQEDAARLARSLRQVGKACGVDVRCLLTDMNSPLGDSAGNALEIKECLDVLAGGGPQQTRELSLVLAAEMVQLAYPEREMAEIRQRLEGHLKEGRALARFRDVVEAQGGDVTFVDEPERLARAKHAEPIKASRAGYVTDIDVRSLGLAVIELGGGRRLVTDEIDPWVGLTGLKRVGDLVEAGEPLALVWSNDEERARRAHSIVSSSYGIGPDRPPVAPMIADRMA